LQATFNPALLVKGTLFRTTRSPTATGHTTLTMAHGHNGFCQTVSGIPPLQSNHCRG
jgi:hypothetical protein